MSDEQEIVLTKRNHKLLNIARICEIVAWVVLAAYILYGFNTYQNNNQYSQPYQLIDSSIFEYFYFYFSIAVDIGLIIIQGVVGLLTLYGVSYGLKMLVETDVNYRLSAGEKSNGG